MIVHLSAVELNCSAVVSESLSGTPPQDLSSAPNSCQRKKIISQFLLKPVPYGAEIFEQRILTLRPGIDYLTQYSDWLNVQNGFLPQLAKDPFDPKVIDPTPRFIRNGRDLAAYVRVDVLFQAYFNAMLVLLGMGAPPPDKAYRRERIPLPPRTRVKPAAIKTAHRSQGASHRPWFRGCS